LALEFWAVVAPLGMRGIALVRVSVHDLHSGHYRFDLTSIQYGVAGRLRWPCKDALEIELLVAGWVHMDNNVTWLLS
jgi:hypothetical protein